MVVMSDLRGLVDDLVSILTQVFCPLRRQCRVPVVRGDCFNPYSGFLSVETKLFHEGVFKTDEFQSLLRFSVR